jgi:hypothetical protein
MDVTVVAVINEKGVAIWDVQMPRGSLAGKERGWACRRMDM